MSKPHFTVLALALASSLVFSACSSFDRASNAVAHIVTPYQVEVVQGNFISQEQVAALRPGLSQQQVRMVLGTPLVDSVFHADRWDYVFTLRRKGLAQEPKRLSVFFENGLLDRIEGDDMPSEIEFVQTIDSKRKLGKVPSLTATDAQLDKASAQASKASRTDLAQPQGERRALDSYPPLEP